ncbi:hypothetical protein HYV43_03775 [Candidatus Micrarchaeota archaeon]|nr:hypothetical protein [Candidatus Micrarchaeota archaeon]
MPFIAVIGRCTPPFSPDVVLQARALGRLLAERGATVLSGACNGLPHEAILAARAVGGKTIGYSPAADRHHHQAGFQAPVDGFDELRFFGQRDWSAIQNFAWRSAHLIDDADAVICIDGSWGTLSEIALVFETEKPFGVLESGGAAGFVRDLENTLARRRMRPVKYGSDAAMLVDAMRSELDL